MRIVGIGGNVLSDAEFEKFHNGVLTILEEVGVQIETPGLMDVLAGAGGDADAGKQRITFKRDVIEKHLSELEPSDDKPHVACSVGVFAGYYLDPFTNEYREWNYDDLRNYIKVGRSVPEVDRTGILTSPIREHGAVGPLYERLLAWKLGAHNGGSILDTRLCPYIYELHQMRAQWLGTKVQKAGSLCAYMISPLRLPRHEGDQIMFFHERGLRVNIGAMITQGVSGPITMAGTAAVSVAQAIAISVINKVLHGTRTLYLNGDMHPADMHTLANCYGRPESAMSQVLIGELARRYKGDFGPHTGHADSKIPGVEAGMQKAMTAVASLIANGKAGFSCGLLSIDEVFSPLQIILDAELAGALRWMIRESKISDESLALDQIKQVGPGKTFMDLDHTLAHFRDELWNPAVWTRDMVQSFLASGKVTAEDRALKKVKEILDGPDLEPGLTEEQEKEMERVIDRAKDAIA